MNDSKFKNIFCLDCILHSQSSIFPDCIAESAQKRLIGEFQNTNDTSKLLDIRARLSQTTRVLENCDPKNGIIYKNSEDYMEIFKNTKLFDRKEFSFTRDNS